MFIGTSKKKRIDVEESILFMGCKIPVAISAKHLDGHTMNDFDSTFKGFKIKGKDGF